MVCVTKYRYTVLNGDIKISCRIILIQICETEDVQILKGVVCKDHIYIEYRHSHNISSIVKLMKGRTSRKLQMVFPELKKRYWVRHFGLLVLDVWSTGDITDKKVKKY
jgi:putative transposase